MAAKGAESGYLARYREMVTSGNRGAILEIPAGGN